MNGKYLTIITVVLNDEKNIEQTILSVSEQKKFFDFEYIVLDGGSSDKTLEIIKKYSKIIDIIKSESDDGLYFALNKASKLASGEYIGIMHSGDTYSKNDIVLKYKEEIIHGKSDLIFSNLKIKSKNKTHRFYNSSFFEKKHILLGWMPPHPTCIIKKKVLEKVGFYNTKYRISSDFDLMLKIIYLNDSSFKHLPITSVIQSRGGISDSGFYSKFILFYEIVRSLKENNLLKNPILPLFRYVIKIRELIFKK